MFTVETLGSDYPIWLTQKKGREKSLPFFMYGWSGFWECQPKEYIVIIKVAVIFLLLIVLATKMY
jgi:hypothetical protein